MTVEEFLLTHPDEDVDLQVPEGRILLDHGQAQRLLGGRPVIVCKTGVQDAQYMQAEDLLNAGGLSGPSDPRPVAGIRGPRSEAGKAGTLLAKTKEGADLMNNRGKNVGLLLTGMALGATLCGGAAAAGIIAVPTWQPIYVDGQQVEMEAYNINGSNYVKLRDAGRQVGFNVYWQNGVQVDTDAPYTGVAPTVTAPAETTETQSGYLVHAAGDHRPGPTQLRQEAGLAALASGRLC